MSRCRMAQLLDRTNNVVEQAGKFLDETDGVLSWGALVGYSMIDSARSNLATIFVPLKPWEERLAKGRSREVIMKELSGKFQKIYDGIRLYLYLAACPWIGHGRRVRNATA